MLQILSFSLYLQNSTLEFVFLIMMGLQMSDPIHLLSGPLARTSFSLFI